MSQNLTQPEEIEHVLMEMAGHGMGVDTPIPDGEQLNGAYMASSVMNPLDDGFIRSVPSP